MKRGAHMSRVSVFKVYSEEVNWTRSRKFSIIAFTTSRDVTMTIVDSNRVEFSRSIFKISAKFVWYFLRNSSFFEGKFLTEKFTLPAIHHNDRFLAFHNFSLPTTSVEW